ncbi:uncharacterized protein PGTG_13399 [Puccinia graminis f. sp. tritici CRL 75-36-700-3]|uniref:Tyrosinase copper-binding domain-containing protein n=1 Tax=Puccinia graminis f. sp. tritici (strain CRL 75-36-700-3 / race SCCL) TaxID=418459 RepID=E3KSA5_PUCGT|nr:uncharacterized protein PGTG_13399 [Puccinia graminis f. sp. tritici CRL 75-36-700-3]EFP87180.2 hypothetical protein PGTG_13399 [Puccinia graminis f. sp. tritici CRL 75-36-700-3]
MEGMTTPPHLRTFAVTGDGVCITQSCHLQGLSENREDGCCNSFSVPKNVHPHEAQSLALSQWQFASWFHKSLFIVYLVRETSSALEIVPLAEILPTNLSASEKRAYQASVSCLLKAPSQMRYPGAVSRYDDLVYVHQRQSDYPNGRDEWHVTGQFLAVHRMYCYIFELMLRDECNYRGRMPYWDEQRDAGNFRNSEFLRDFGGPGDERGMVTQGPFANFEINLGPGFQNVRRRLHRQINETASAMAGPQYYQKLMAQPTFASFLNEIRQHSHIAGHNGVGGELGDVQTAAVDSIFFNHHLYIDWLWASWQEADPQARIFDLRGAGYETQANPTQETNLLTTLKFLGLAPDVPLYGSLDIQVLSPFEH